jgi:hypothetical protein
MEAKNKNIKDFDAVAFMREQRKNLASYYQK